MHYFFNFLLFNNVSSTTNMNTYGSWKNCKLYILCTLILFNPLHLTIGSKLILTKSSLWVPKFKMLLCTFYSNFCLYLGYQKDTIKIIVLLSIMILIIHVYIWWKVVHLSCAFTHQCQHGCELCILGRIPKWKKCLGLIPLVFVCFAKIVETLHQIFWSR